MKEILKQVIFDQREKLVLNPIINRKINSYIYTIHQIIVLSGIRRCGKSVLLNQIKEKNKEKDYYLNFDDERLIHFTSNHFQELIEVFLELFGEQNTYYFDEIQNIIGWERFVRRLHDAGKKVYITGSNATMLSRELGTHLTGRYIQIELFPFSFKEFLEYHSIKTNQETIYSTKGKVALKKKFDEYMKVGGFPLNFKQDNPFFIKTLYQNILYRDVMVRNHLVNEKEIAELIYLLASNVSKLSSYASLAKSIGVKSTTTIKNYIEYISNTYLLFQIPLFDYSLKVQLKNPKKTYFIDNAIVNQIGFNFSENIGRNLENIVFLELKRQGYEIFYHQKKTECDFVIRENNKIQQAIQVTAYLDNIETKKRELNGLIQAMKEYDLKTGLILTLDTESEEQIEDFVIKIMPVWKWLVL